MSRLRKPVSPAIQYSSAPKWARPNRYPPTNAARGRRPASRSRNARKGHSPTRASGRRSSGGQGGGERKPGARGHHPPGASGPRPGAPGEAPAGPGPRALPLSDVDDLAAVVAAQQPDVIVLTDDQSCSLALEGLLDEAGEDAKLICVPPREARWDGVDDVGDLTPQLMAEIQHFFEVYKALEPGKYSSTHGIGGQDDAWRDAMRDVVRNEVRPAMQRYRDEIARDLLPHGRDDDHAGLSWLDGGDRIYRDKARITTSLDVDPEEVHAIGRDYIDGPLAEEFSALGQRVFGIDTISGVFGRMRNDDDLRYHSAEQMVDDATAALDRARATIDLWFGRLPVADCIVTPVPEFLASSAPPAYYFPPASDGSRGGTYFLNTANASSMFRFEGPATAFHEAIPGHHLQLAIAGELEGVPAFQQHALQTAYAEGWGLYAERLADEMGLYTSERELLGMLALDAFRAARLVVDTGLHAKGWSRDQAIEYMRKHTPLPLDTISVEVDRYIAIPGQALAYKLGQLQIRRLRDHAEQALGDQFDVRGFHDTVLGSGMVTLGVLTSLVDEWISDQATP